MVTSHETRADKKDPNGGKILTLSSKFDDFRLLALQTCIPRFRPSFSSFALTPPPPSLFLSRDSNNFTIILLLKYKLRRELS